MIKELTIPIVCSTVMLQAKNKIKLLFEEKGRVNRRHTNRSMMQYLTQKTQSGR